MFLKTKNVHYFLLLLVANVLLTLWTVYASPVLDYDAILYLLAAEAIANNDWALSSSLYKGAFYPYLIYLSQAVTGLSYEISAHLLNALFFTITSFAFVKIVQQLGGTSKTVLAMGLLLVLFYPSLLKYRADIFREFGFFCCYFWSIFCLLKYHQTKQYSYLLIWAFLLAFGTLFRVESAILLASIGTLMAGTAIFENASNFDKKQLVKYLVATSIVCLVAIGSIYFILDADSWIFSSLLYPVNYIDNALIKLQRNMIGDGSALFVLWTSLQRIIYVILQRSELIYLLLAFLAYKMRLVLNKPYEFKVIAYYLGVCFFILIVFDMSLGYLSSRYALSFVLTSALLVPFILEKLITIFKQGSLLNKLGVSFLLLTLCFLSVKRLTINEDTAERLSGIWAAENLDKNSVIYSNNSKLLYYADRFPYYGSMTKGYHRFNTKLLNKELNPEVIENAEYIFLLVKIKIDIDLEKEALYTQKFGKPVKRFQKKNHRYVNVYKVN